MSAIKDLTNPDTTLNLFFQACTPWWRSALLRIRRHRGQLLALDTLSRGWTIRNRRFAGRQTVPIGRIQGSESRVTDFDAAFRPRAHGLAERWCSVAHGWQQGAALPPVELICIGDVYFVRDGHHRISVAATYGAREIDALVTVWEVDGLLPWERPAVAPQNQELSDRGLVGQTNRAFQFMGLHRGPRRSLVPERRWRDGSPLAS